MRRGLGGLTVCLAVLVALAAAGCGTASGGASAAPAGTVGRYGLHTDPSLLTRLPTKVDGEPVAESADLETPALDDPNLARSADAFVAAYVGGLSGPDWAAVSVVRLKPASQTDQFYGDWRDQYDEAACSQAGGVAVHTSEQIGGRPVDVGTCNGGLLTYHVRLEDGLLVSVTELGPRRLGRQLLESIP